MIHYHRHHFFRTIFHLHFTIWSNISSPLDYYTTVTIPLPWDHQVAIIIPLDHFNTSWPSSLSYLCWTFNCNFMTPIHCYHLLPFCCEPSPSCYLIVTIMWYFLTLPIFSFLHYTHHLFLWLLSLFRGYFWR